MPYKDREDQRAAVRRHKVHSRLGPNPDREALLEAEVRSLKARLKRQCSANRDARLTHAARRSTGLTGKAENAAIKKRLTLVAGDLEDGGRSAFPGLAIEAAIEDVRRLISDIELGAVK